MFFQELQDAFFVIKHKAVFAILYKTFYKGDCNMCEGYILPFGIGVCKCNSP